MLTGYEVIVYSCSSKLLPIISDIQRQNEFQISYYADMAHDDLLEKTCSARISITNNLSDGVPNTMLEAMALGAFPIQSNTAITEGWIEDGKNGLLTNPRDINQIAEAISKALTDDRLVDDAAVLNGRLVREKLNFNTIKTQIEDLYKTASGKSKTVAH
jgi:glycosyltransferase involved in cell wall biosynthesis